MPCLLPARLRRQRIRPPPLARHPRCTQNREKGAVGPCRRLLYCKNKSLLRRSDIFCPKIKERRKKKNPVSIVALNCCICLCQTNRYRLHHKTPLQIQLRGDYLSDNFTESSSEIPCQRVCHVFMLALWAPVGTQDGLLSARG